MTTGKSIVNPKIFLMYNDNTIRMNQNTRKIVFYNNILTSFRYDSGMGFLFDNFLDYTFVRVHMNAGRF